MLEMRVICVAKSVKPPAKEEKAKGKGKEKALVVSPPSKVSFSNPSQFVEEILDKTSSLLISEVCILPNILSLKLVITIT